MQTKENTVNKKKQLSKLANTSWDADPKTLKQTAKAVCYSTVEYCSPEKVRTTQRK